MEPAVQKNSSTFNFKLPAAFTAALIVCAAIRFGDLPFPVTAFTHRVWEALIVHENHSMLPGPFYPSQKLSMEEQGDLTPYTPFAVKKKVSWETDRYGYRKKDTENRNYPIVIVGDSTTLGTALDQPHMLSERLERIMDVRVYPFAPYYEMDTYLQSRFYQEHPPKQVVFSMMEWALPDLLESKPGAPLPQKQSLLKKIMGDNNYTRLGILLDRGTKLSLMRFMNARFKGWVKSKLSKQTFQTAKTSEGTMIFPGGDSAHKHISVKMIPQIIAVLKRYQSDLKQRGIEMYFVPVPNKESLYYQLLQVPQVPIFYLTLVEACNQAGIPALNLLEIYANEQVRNQRLLYHLDDSHWNRFGTEVAAQNLARILQKKANE